MPPFDLWLRGPRRHPHAGGSGPGSAARARGVIPTVPRNGSPAFGQYKPTSRRRLRAVGAAGARARRRQDRRVHVLPRHRDALPAVRAAAARLDAVARLAEDVAQAHERDQLDAARATRAAAGPAAARRPRAAAARARRRSLRRPTPPRRRARRPRLAASSAQTRSQSPGRSSRDRAVDLERDRPRRPSQTSIGRPGGIHRRAADEFRADRRFGR